MINNNFKQTVLKTIEDYESMESFLFLRGYRRESRVVRESVQMLAEGLIAWEHAKGFEQTTIEIQTQNIMVATNEFVTSVLQVEVNRYL